jgi:CubicO group peptidase (beta-lactamase class C family)
MNPTSSRTLTGEPISGPCAVTTESAFAAPTRCTVPGSSGTPHLAGTLPDPARAYRRACTVTAAAAVVLVGLPSGAAAQVPPDAGLRVDEIFARWTSVESPGCAVGVTVDGLTVLERAYGMADLEHGIPNSPETIFEGGSLSKQFTSAAVVLLALEGKLSLDDDIRTYLPEVPDYGETITLHHLMTHTSGLRDWGSVAGISGWGREQRSHDHDDVLDIVSRQSALNFEPGHEYSYSNTGYNLLAMIVTRVSGVPFAEFSKRRIFEPLGMRDTQWRDDYRRIVPGRSTAYSATDDGWEINRPIEHVHGNGGILTTVGDLAIWNRTLTDGTLGGDAFVEMMHRRGRLNDGSEIVYAGGLRIEEFRGVPSITHTGSTAGYRAFLGRYPEQGLSVAMLCNASNVSTGGNGGRIAAVFLGDAAARSGTAMAEAVAGAERYAGLFRDPVTGGTIQIDHVEDGSRLRRGNTPLTAVGARRLAVGDSETVYAFARDYASFSVESWQYTDERYERVEPWTPTEAELAQLTGTYHSEDAETTYVVRVESGQLVIWQRPNDTRRYAPIYRDAFRSGGYIVRFRRDGSGPPGALSLSLGRVYDMRFERVGG